MSTNWAVVGASGRVGTEMVTGDWLLSSASVSAVRNWKTTLVVPGVLTSHWKSPQSGRVGGMSHVSVASKVREKVPDMYVVVGTFPGTTMRTGTRWTILVKLPVALLAGSSEKTDPVAGAMETTGAADLVARFFLDSVAQGNAVVGLALILVVTMFLSDLMNNAATAAVMCPIAIGTAAALGASADAFLMAVAIGASCAFLTPIGHQNNTLILGPGGFRFGDYWRLGLPLELLVIAVAVPLLLVVWPL